MFVAVAAETMIGGRRIELEAAHSEATAALAREAGFVGSRLLHFAGAPYTYLYEMTWQSRDDWERFWDGAGFTKLRATIDAQLSEPFALSLYNVRQDG